VGAFQGSLGRVTSVKHRALLTALGEMNRLRIMRLLLKERLGVNTIVERC